MQSKILVLVGAMILGGGFSCPTSEAGHYSRWQRRSTYYYSYYYYTPVRYHHVVYYPKQPRYYYYYNPYRKVYWGRFDLEGAPGKQYSILAAEDRRGDLNEIPESAFPPAGPMSSEPESDSAESLAVPPLPPTE